MTKIVITGGTHSGKTSVIEALSAKGYRTVQEAAEKIILEINSLIGVEKQIEWRKKHFDAFQDLIWQRIIKLEQEASHSDSLVFCDRGLLDGFAYRKQSNNSLQDDARTHFAGPVDYKLAFVFETLPNFSPRTDTGRISTYEVSCETGRLLAETYQDHNVPTISVPVMSIAQRCDFIIEKVQEHFNGS